jgi:hypothetical protein
LRERDHALAYYDNFDYQLRDTLQTLEKYFQDTILEVWELSMQNFTPKLYGGGLLITMEDSLDFSPILMIDIAQKRTVSFPFSFSKIKGEAGLIILR